MEVKQGSEESRTLAFVCVCVPVSIWVEFSTSGMVKGLWRMGMCVFSTQRGDDLELTDESNRAKR